MKRTLAILFVMVLSVTASICNAQIKVRGNVTEKSGVALIGAAVVIQGTIQGCITDESGSYTLKAPQGRKLIASMVGYKTKEERVQQVVNFILKEDRSINIENPLSTLANIITIGGAII